MWGPIIAALIAELLPLLTEALKAWLEKVLKKTAEKLGDPLWYGGPLDQRLTLLDTAIDDTPWWKFSRKAALRRVRDHLEGV